MKRVAAAAVCREQAPFPRDTRAACRVCNVIMHRSMIYGRFRVEKMRVINNKEGRADEFLVFISIILVFISRFLCKINLRKF